MGVKITIEVEDEIDSKIIEALTALLKALADRRRIVFLDDVEQPATKRG